MRRALGTHRPVLDTAEKQAAVAVVLRSRSPLEPVDVLFIRRAEHPEDPWSGHMAFPGGRVDDSDVDPLTAAVRETAEELALDLAIEAQLIGRLSSVPVMARGRRLPMVIEPFVFDLGSAEPAMKPNHEVDKIHWIPLSFFADPTNRELFLWKRGDLSFHLPCYHWEGNRVWGLTLGMVDELMALQGIEGSRLEGVRA